MRLFRPTRLVGAVLATTLLLSGVAGCSRPRLQAAPTPGCPSRYPSPAGPATAVLVPAGAGWVVDCGYGYPLVHPPQRVKVFRAGPVGGPVVRGAAVAGYALLLDQAPATRGVGCLRSATGSPKDALIFGYPDGRRLVLDWRASCPALAGPGGRLIALSQLSSEYLTGLSFFVTSPDAPERVPDVVGLALSAATRAAARAGFQLTDDAEIADHAPLGTVLVQGLAAGSAVAGGQFGVQLSAPPSTPACTAAQLRAAVYPDEPGAGASFGTIAVRDVAAEACALPGPLELTPFDPAGRALSAAQRSGIRGPLVLSGQAPASWPPSPTTLLAEVSLTSLDFAGSCTGSVHRPSAWRVSFPGGGEITAAVLAGPHRFPPILVCDRHVEVGPVSLG